MKKNLQFCVSEQEFSNCRNGEDKSDFCLLSFNSLLFASFASSVTTTSDLNNTSPESEGVVGKKKGAFSGFFGGSIGLLRIWNTLVKVSKHCGLTLEK